MSNETCWPIRGLFGHYDKLKVYPIVSQFRLAKMTNSINGAHFKKFPATNLYRSPAGFTLFRGSMELALKPYYSQSTSQILYLDRHHGNIGQSNTYLVDYKQN